MRIRRKWLVIFSLIYLYLPIVIFLLGWTRLIICFICFTAIGYAFIHAYPIACGGDDEGSMIRLDPLITIFAFLFFLWIGYYAGWGRWVDQAGDWNKHNAVLSDLVNKSWPVYYSNGKDHSMLVYYIAQYIVPGFIGKQAGSVRTAEIMLYVWNEAGLFLAFIHAVTLVKADRYIMQFITAVVLPFFGIPLWISEYVLRLVSDFNRVGEGFWYFWEGDILIQYSHNFTLLRWVVPQVIACWIIMALFMELRDAVEVHALIALPGLLFGTLSFLGMIPIIIAGDCEMLFRGRSLKNAIRKVLSIENILIMFTLGVVLGLYFYGNVFSEKPDSVGLSMIQYNSDIIVYFVFVFVNILVYAVILWKDNGSDPVFFFSIVMLIILPLFRMGVYNDLVMRSSIPGLFVLMILILRFINKYMAGGDNTAADSVFLRVSKLIVIVFIITGLFYPFLEFSDVVRDNDSSELGSGYEWATLEEYADRDLSENDDLKYNYYAYDIESNLFYKFVARKKL